MSNLQIDMKGKVALITGAASGIGRATALDFARAGARVVVADVDGLGAEDTVAIIHRDGGQALAARIDVSSSDQVEALVARTVATYGGLDYAFNNAGIEGATGTNLADLAEADWDRLIAVNLKGTWLCMKYEIPRMIENGGGAIVNCASVAGLVGFPGAAAYVASKHGMIGLTRTAALELAHTNVRVNAVCPGVIHTSMIDRATGNDRAKVAAYASAEPVGRLGRPEEIAGAVVWLCSDASSFVTGVALPVDGGWVAQ